MSEQRVQTIDFTGSPVAEAFYSSNGEADACLGPINSGKTFAMMARTLRHVIEQPPGSDGVARSRVAIVRNTYRALRDTAIPSYQAIFIPEFFGEITLNAMTHRARFTLDGRRYELETLFRALDDEAAVRGLLSLNLSFAVINELREINAEVFSMLRARCGRFPAMSEGGGPRFGGIIADSNAWADEHWAHKLWVTEPAEGFRLFRQPPAIVRQGAKWVENPRAENAKHRRPGYYLAQVSTMDEEARRVYLQNEWASLRGQRPVASYYRDDFHCREVEPWGDVDFIAGCDPGLNAATVIGQVCADGFRALLEVTTEGTPLDEHVQLVRREFARVFPGRRLRTIYVDPAGDQRSAQTGATTTTAMRRLYAPSVVMVAPGENNIGLRIDALQSQLRTVNRRGEPSFIVHPRCRNLRRALQSAWRYKEIRGASGQYESKPYKLDAASHVADALCYFMLGGGAARSLGMPGALGGGLDPEFVEACQRRNAEAHRFLD